MVKKRAPARRPPISDFRIPEPKGPRLDRKTLAKSTSYVAPDLEPDPEEAEAFGLAPGRTRRSVRRQREVETHLTPAQRRMRARAAERVPIAPEETDEEIDEEEEEDAEADDSHETGGDTDDFDAELARATAVTTATTATTAPAAPHPVSPFGAPTPATHAEPHGLLRSTSVPTLFAQCVAQEDVDRLWDWIRRDAMATKTRPQFMGREHATSRSLHSVIEFLVVEGERNGTAIIRAIYNGPHHLGFAMLAPIMAEEATALMHLYLREDIRGQFGQFLAPLVEIAQQAVPGFHLAAMAMDPAIRRWHRQVLVPLGFTEHVLFAR